MIITEPVGSYVLCESVLYFFLFFFAVYFAKMNNRRSTDFRYARANFHDFSTVRSRTRTRGYSSGGDFGIYYSKRCSALS